MNKSASIQLYTTMVIEGIDNESLAKDVLSKSDCRISDDPLQSRYEDTEFPNTENTKDLILKIDSEIYEMDCNLEKKSIWSHILEPQQSTIPHNHQEDQWDGGHPDDNGLSFVYYVTYPENSGDLVFELSAVQRRISQNIKPVVGNLVLFPTYIPHYTKRNTSKEIRISISGNYWPDVDKLDEFFREVYDGRSNYFNYVGVYNS